MTNPAGPNTRVAVIGPSFFSYVQAIAETFRARGFAVSVFDEKHSNRPLAKLRYRRGLYSRQRGPLAAHLAAIREDLVRAQTTDVFLINTETPDRAFVESLNALGMRVHLYMWDGAANKPGFPDLLGFVASFASFDPRDCERFAMRYIPLFAESLFDEAGREAEGQPPRYDICLCGTVHSSRTGVVARLLQAERAGRIRLGLLLYYHSRALLYAKSVTDRAVWKIARHISFKGFPKSDIAAMLAASRAVLDVPHHGQTGLTARTFEALATGTRLMTTHPRALELLPDSFVDRIVAIDGVEQALATDFAALAPLPPLTDEQRYYLSLDRFVDALAEMAGIGQSGGDALSHQRHSATAIG